MGCRNPWRYGLIAILCSCAAPGGDEIGIGSTRSAVSVDNDLSYNRLALNRLALNRLALNRLALNRLALNRLALNSLDSLEATEEGRDFLRYTAQCALRAGDILVAEHQGQEYEFPGLLGIAPEWEHRPLSETEQRLVSACLIAHVNAYGESVHISLRSPDVLDADASERAHYPVYEGTFFGQVFDGESLDTYGCQGDNPVIARAHAVDRLKRVCTDPSEDCGVVSVGRCRDVCERLVDEQGWTGCWGGGRRYAETMSVFLLADDPDGENDSCFGRPHCYLRSEREAAAMLDCSTSHRCRMKCGRDGVCTLDSAGAGCMRALVSRGALGELECLDARQCSLTCEEDSRCEVDCVGAESCKVHCEHDAACEINCRDAGDCEEIRCASGAQCLLRCNDAEHCEFASCSGELTHCPGDVIVCGRPCP